MKKIRFTLRDVILVLAACLFPFSIQSQPADQDILLYTQYTSRSVTPGKSVSYAVDVINRTNSIQNISLDVRGLPGSWDPTLTAGANTVHRIAVKPESLSPDDFTQTVDLNLNVPLQIKKGNYYFRLYAKSDSGLDYELPLHIRVTEQGIFQTELQVDQANMEGYVDSDFNYDVTLRNQTAQDQNYALTSKAPPGWDVRFRVGRNYVTSVSVGSNESQDIRVNVKPPQQASADTFRVGIRAMSGSTSDQAELEAVIKGKYQLEVTTPSGRLSTEVTAGSEKDLQLQLQNTGTVPLRDIELSSSTPTDWSVSFDKDQVNRLDPGETTLVNATIRASEKAIAGDYQLKIDGQTDEASSNATFRVTVKKSVLWGSIGIFIIVLVLGGISFLFKKYGRR